MPNDATTAKILGAGGFGLTADLILFVRAAVLPDPGPEETQNLTVDGRLYRLDKKTKLPGGEVFMFTCNDANQGA